MINKMKKLNEYENEWVLLDKNSNVLFHSKEFADVYDESMKYPRGKNSIARILKPGTCCY